MRPLLIIILGEFLKAVTEGYSPIKKSEGGRNNSIIDISIKIGEKE